MGLGPGPRWADRPYWGAGRRPGGWRVRQALWGPPSPHFPSYDPSRSSGLTVVPHSTWGLPAAPCTPPCRAPRVCPALSSPRWKVGTCSSLWGRSRGWAETLAQEPACPAPPAGSRGGTGAPGAAPWQGPPLPRPVGSPEVPSARTAPGQGHSRRLLLGPHHVSEGQSLKSPDLSPQHRAAGNGLGHAGGASVGQVPPLGDGDRVPRELLGQTSWRASWISSLFATW